MPDPLYSALNAVTEQKIRPRVIIDNLFKDMPGFVQIRDKGMTSYSGGIATRYPFLFRNTRGGFFGMGQGNFDTTKVDLLSAFEFPAKFAYESAVIYKEESQVINSGPAAIYSLAEVQLEVALRTLNLRIALAAQQHGQGSGTGVASDRSDFITGWAECLNDGKTNSWQGDYFTAYGGATRNGVVGAALNSEPRWLGDSAGSPGPISYNALEGSYQDAWIGQDAPDLGITSKYGLAAIKNALQAHQMLHQETDPVYGFSGVRLNKALIVKDDYWPSQYGENADFGDFRTPGGNSKATFNSAATVGTNSRLPTSTAITVGEVLLWLNTDTWIFLLSDDPEFRFGFTGWKPEVDSLKLAGQMLFAGNFFCAEPRKNKQVYGFSAQQT